jgi:A/G-specific adenine glycosylase
MDAAKAARSPAAANLPAVTLQARLLAWYDRHRRRLPWRAEPGRRPDPYHVWISEVMLQQTTVATVGPRFAAFIRRFSSPAALAAASEAEVLHEWQGLGYYRRARALHAAARALVADHGGRLPAEAAALRRLPGIGDYTAAAICAIAFDQPALPVDGNVERVLVRLVALETPLPAARGVLRRLAAALAPDRRAGDLAQALMDLGATVCRPGAPACGRCPWQADCAAHAAGIAAELPRRAARPVRPLRRGLAFLLRRADGAILFRRRPPEGLLGGLHELPSSPWLEGPLDLPAALAHAPASAAWQHRAAPVRHVFTHFELELRLAEAATATPPAGLWLAPAELHRLALPSVMRKLLRVAGLAVPPSPRAASAD